MEEMSTVYVQIECTADMIRVPRQQAVLRGESVASTDSDRLQKKQMKAEAKAHRMAMEKGLMAGAKRGSVRGVENKVAVDDQVQQPEGVVDISGAVQSVQVQPAGTALAEAQAEAEAANARAARLGDGLMRAMVTQQQMVEYCRLRGVSVSPEQDDALMQKYLQLVEQQQDPQAQFVVDAGESASGTARGVFGHAEVAVVHAAGMTDEECAVAGAGVKKSTSGQAAEQVSREVDVDRSGVRGDKTAYAEAGAVQVDQERWFSGNLGTSGEVLKTSNFGGMDMRGGGAVTAWAR